MARRASGRLLELQLTDWAMFMWPRSPTARFGKFPPRARSAPSPAWREIREPTTASGDNAQFRNPWGVAVDRNGTVYVADTSSCTIRKITPAGAVSTFAGLAGNPGSSDGLGGQARFCNPHGVAADGAGNLYVADTGNNTIRKITAAGHGQHAGGAGGQSRIGRWRARRVAIAPSAESGRG